jgi:PTS system fructose-specific IIA component
MHVQDLFRPEDLIVGFEPADKWDAIRQLVDHLVAGGRIPAARRDAILQAVLSRERSMSTGMENGIAIPHAAVEGIDDVVAAMGIVTREGGLAFESIDGRPTHVVVLLVIPKAKKLLHIRTLADVARVLGRNTVRESLIAAADRERALEVLVQGESGK